MHYSEDRAKNQIVFSFNKYVWASHYGKNQDPDKLLKTIRYFHPVINIRTLGLETSER